MIPFGHRVQPKTRHVMFNVICYKLLRYDMIIWTVISPSYVAASPERDQA